MRVIEERHIRDESWNDTKSRKDLPGIHTLENIGKLLKL